MSAELQRFLPAKSKPPTPHNPATYNQTMSTKQRQSTQGTVPIRANTIAIFSYELNPSDGSLEPGPRVTWRGQEPNSTNRSAIPRDFKAHMSSASSQGLNAHEAAAIRFCAQSSAATFMTCAEAGEPDPDTEEATACDIILVVD
jgi:hypothetical protein